ncbi:MAG: hypothetical protein OXR84_08745 [Magnetovibrio sp.]|nr:hypothetical protein [Magnetovibrio sp.]
MACRAAIALIGLLGPAALTLGAGPATATCIERPPLILCQSPEGSYDAAPRPRPVDPKAERRRACWERLRMARRDLENGEARFYVARALEDAGPACAGQPRMIDTLRRLRTWMVWGTP